MNKFSGTPKLNTTTIADTKSVEKIFSKNDIHTLTFNDRESLKYSQKIKFFFGRELRKHNTILRILEIVGNKKLAEEIRKKKDYEDLTYQNIYDSVRAFEVFLSLPEKCKTNLHKNEHKEDCKLEITKLRNSVGETKNKQPFTNEILKENQFKKFAPGGEKNDILVIHGERKSFESQYVSSLIQILSANPEEQDIHFNEIPEDLLLTKKYGEVFKTHLHEIKKIFKESKNTEQVRNGLESLLKKTTGEKKNLDEMINTLIIYAGFIESEIQHSHGDLQKMKNILRHANLSQYIRENKKVVLNDNNEFTNGTHIAPQKKFNRALEKTIIKYGGDLSKLMDLTRSTLEFKNLVDLENGIKGLLKVCRDDKYIKEICIVDDMGAIFEQPKKGTGFRVVKLYCKIHNGGAFEIQFNVSESLKGKIKGIKELITTIQAIGFTNNEVETIQQEMKIIQSRDLTKEIKRPQTNEDRLSGDTCYQIARSIKHDYPKLEEKLIELEKEIHNRCREQVMKRLIKECLV